MPSFRATCAAFTTILLASCSAPPAPPPLITEESPLAAHEGQIVTIRGILRASQKWTTVLDVRVRWEPALESGCRVEATGVLRRWNVAPPPSVWDSSSVRYGDYFTLDDPHQPNRLASIQVVRTEGPDRRSGA